MSEFRDDDLTPYQRRRMYARRRLKCAECGRGFLGFFSQWCQQCYSAKARLRDVAHGTVTYAIACGKLVSAKTLICMDCGSQAQGYDHREYAKPLDVVPVCQSCNLSRGRAVEFGGKLDAIGKRGRLRAERQDPVPK